MTNSQGSILDRKVKRLFNYPLTIKQQVWLHFIIPGVCTCTLYILNFSLDFSVGLDLLNRNKIISGLATLCLMYLPASIVYLRQISVPPSTKTTKTTTVWILKETTYLIFFPLRLMEQLGKKLFWLIEILRSDENIEENLWNYEKCANEPALTYMFVLIFLQNIPQALLQIYLLANGTSSNSSTNIAQLFCAIVSVLNASVGIASYHRYESQIIAGRATVWHDSKDKNNPEQMTTCQADPLMSRRNSDELRETTNDLWIRGIEEENPAGKVLLISFWFLLLFGRTMVIGIMMNFYPKTVVFITIIHATLFFIYYTTYSVDIFNKIFLSNTSIFFIVEVGIKFQKTVYLYMLFIISNLVEDVGFTILWYVWGTWHSPWYNYAAYAIINAHLLALIVFAYYMAFKRPETVFIKSS